jgi:hypothetical protein
MTRGRIRMLSPETLYPTDPECLLVVFDVRESQTTAALHSQRAAWAEHSDIEALDEVHFVLIVRPGWVSEKAA